MNAAELCQKLKSGEITLDHMGHQVNSTVEEIYESYLDWVELSKGSGDGRWTIRDGASIEKVNLSMREFYTRDLNDDIAEGSTIYSLSGIFRRKTCFECGVEYGYQLHGNKLVLCSFYNPDKPLEKPFFGSMTGDFDSRPLDFRCPFEHPKPFYGSITISSSMVFSNLFPSFDNSPDDMRHTREYSLNSTAGCYNTAEYKTKQNIAYGQMGNMSIGIYVNKGRDSVIVGPAYNPMEWEDYPEMTEEEYELACSKPLFDGYKMVGTICLDVWRYEASDFNTVKNDFLTRKEAGRDVIQIKVKKGVWDFEHRYCIIKSDKNDHIYAKFTLRK